MAKSYFEQKCRICGCDWNHACNDRDYWFAEDLCSACAEKMRPILFNTSMVQAILNGRKTTTRRVIKPPVEVHDCTDGIFVTRPIKVGGEYCRFAPYEPFQTGDVLYVRETWGISNFDEGESTMTVQYKVDDTVSNVVLPPDKFQKYYDSMTGAEPDWHPSIFMPKEAARIFLRVKGVRVERLYDITEDGAKAEGFNAMFYKGDIKDCPDMEYTAKDEFLLLFEETLGKKGPEICGGNPWVWVLLFERC